MAVIALDFHARRARRRDKWRDAAKRISQDTIDLDAGDCRNCHFGRIARPLAARRVRQPPGERDGQCDRRDVVLGN